MCSHLAVKMQITNASAKSRDVSYGKMSGANGREVTPTNRMAFSSTEH